VFGAAFNPPHLGHLVLAQEAHAQLGLDRVLLVPTGVAPHKRIESDPGADVRLEMTRLAVEGDDRFEVSALEVEREGPSFTHETLQELAEPDEERELVFVMGADAALGFGEWREPERIVELARLAVAPRRGAERDKVEEALGAAGAADRVSFVEMPEIGVSSSMVRERSAAGSPVRFLVPDRIAELIESERIYGE
jgi:nicotinate-nucleotide adenylyltransferase